MTTRLRLRIFTRSSCKNLSPISGISLICGSDLRSHKNRICIDLFFLKTNPTFQSQPRQTANTSAKSMATALTVLPPKGPSLIRPVQLCLKGFGVGNPMSNSPSPLQSWIGARSNLFCMLLTVGNLRRVATSRRSVEHRPFKMGLG